MGFSLLEGFSHIELTKQRANTNYMLCHFIVISPLDFEGVLTVYVTIICCTIFSLFFSLGFKEF
jgi:hypothetical protein